VKGSLGDDGADLEGIGSEHNNESVAFSLLELVSWSLSLMTMNAWRRRGDVDASDVGVEGGDMDSADEIEKEGVDGADACDDGDDDGEVLSLRLVLGGSVVASRNVNSIGERGPSPNVDIGCTKSCTRSDHLLVLPCSSTSSSSEPVGDRSVSPSLM
jgi:hypothetical protein